ncbi:hypothetical protein B7P43_G09631 [Cryptotermes secundus]|uniref:Uncharacterized protein n=1 Tax=Cryptotermes secundus TaxID=105785 RepID=A0A2J7R7K7_9NEOP|nr:hypothetical protein B7P43_G09631 [Cryptotermes secundus]
MDSEEEVVVTSCLLAEEEQKRTRKRKIWVHKINKKRVDYGEYHTLFPDLVDDDVKFFKYFRTTYAKFSELLNILRPHLVKQNTEYSHAIEPQQRLAVCLRFNALRWLSLILVHLELQIAPETVPPPRVFSPDSWRDGASLPPSTGNCNKLEWLQSSLSLDTVQVATPTPHATGRLLTVTPYVAKLLAVVTLRKATLRSICLSPGGNVAKALQFENFLKFVVRGKVISRARISMT